MTLTVQQQKVVDYIAAFRTEHDVSPTVREIANHLGVQISTAQHHIERLVRDEILVQPSIPGRPGMAMPRGLRPGRAAMKAETHDV
jgi:SOS-response transcriptional repressor LexA